MTRPIEPLAAFTRRIPEAGRIRFGMKGDRGQPRSLDTFRFTSSDRATLEQLAELYGGTVKPWSPTRTGVQFEVVSTASEMDVVVPPNALGDSPVYELWSAAGLLRRCDGERTVAPVSTEGGTEMGTQPCICSAKKKMECKPVTRVNLLIPDIAFTGVWRLEAKGWNAAHELPGMIDMVGSLTERGLARATLALEKRSSKAGGQTHNFVVPVIRVPVTLNEIAGGGATLTAIGTGRRIEMAELPAADDVIEVEPVEDDDFDPDIEDATVIDEHGALLHQVWALVAKLELSTDDLMGFAYVVSDGKERKVQNLTLAELDRVVRVLDRVHAGSLVYTGLKGQRAVVVVPGK